MLPREAVYKVCPRCKQSLAEHFFVEPVVICMVCYSQLPANLGLEPEELFAKAKLSRWARYNSKHRKDNRLHAMSKINAAVIRHSRLAAPKVDVQAMLHPEQGRPAISIDQPTGLDGIAGLKCNCDGCSVELDGIVEPVKTPQGPMILCEACKVKV